MADEVMASVSDTHTHRHSTCEDTGHPAAVVDVEVRSWTTPREARRFLRHHEGLTFDRGQVFTADGRYQVHEASYTESDGEVLVGLRFLKVTS